MHSNRIEQLDHIGMHTGGKTRQIVGNRVRLIQRLRNPLGNGDTRQHDRQIRKCGPVRQATSRQFVCDLENRCSVSCLQRIQQTHEVALIDRTQHAAHSLLGQIAGTVGDRLVCQGKRITHGAGSSLP